MNELANLFLFTLCYYETDDILELFLSYKNNTLQEYSITQYDFIRSANIYILVFFLVFTFELVFFSKHKNYTLYSLSLIYIKYVVNNLFYGNNITTYHNDNRMSLMWLFTTPLILKLYCDINKLKLLEVNAHYHLTSNVLHILLYNFRNTSYQLYIIVFLTSFEFYFIYKLYNFKQQRYTKFIIWIWSIFSFINIIESLNIVSNYNIQIYYLLSDMIAKLTIVLIVSDYDEQTYHIKYNADLQSITLISNLKRNIKEFENTTQLTPICKTILNTIENRLSSFIPYDKTILKVELLKKILPLELEERYLNNSNDYKPYDFICVLFTDIVSYTELAKDFDTDVIYKLLNKIYTRFDEIIKRYGNLQKIETIGDAYMVVSDIYTNDQKDNVKNMLLFAFDILKEIKNIKSPNGNPLQLRIGLNLGRVVIGILGIEIPRLCVIGNTVNVANRLQTLAEPDTIQISRHVYEIAKETDFGMDIQYEKKENVYLKNIGTTTAYVITPPQFQHNKH